jgi:hypothetical protein
MFRHLLLAGAFAACASAAFAQTPPEGGPHPGGGRLFISPCGEPFRGPDGLGAWFARADTDHDGALTLAEFRADAMTFFKVLDLDKDGFIDSHENQVYETQVAPEITRTGPDDGGEGGGAPAGGGRHGGHGGGRGGGGGHGGGGGEREGDESIASRVPGQSQSHRQPREGAARFSLINEPQPVRGADLNLDWKVSAEEWAKTAGKRFAMLDADGDGKLTLDTLPLPGGGRPGRG